MLLMYIQILMYLSIHSDFKLIETDQTFYFYTVNYNNKSVINCFISGSKVPNTTFFFFRSENPCSSGSLILEAPSKHVSPIHFRISSQRIVPEVDHPIDRRFASRKQLKFSKKWVKGWMIEYRVSLKKTNKRFQFPKLTEENVSLSY